MNITKEAVDKYLADNFEAILILKRNKLISWAQIANKIAEVNNTDVPDKDYVRKRFLKLEEKQKDTIGAITWNEGNPTLNGLPYKLESNSTSSEKYTYSEKRDREGNVQIDDIVDRKLTDDEIFDRYGRDKETWKINQVWFKDTQSGFRLSVNFAPIKETQQAVDYQQAFKEFVEDRNLKILSSPQPKKYEKSKKEGEYLLELSIPDLHLSKFGHDKEVGKDYDSEIAKDYFTRSVVNLVEKATNIYKLDRILLVIGNDFYNADGKSGATTAGTPQDCDSRWYKMFKEGLELVTESVDYCKQYAPRVDLYIVPGNHDRQTSYYLGVALEAFYRKDEQVIINNSPKTRKYYNYGVSLLGYTHGDREKQDSLPLIMAQEQPELWAKARFKEWRLGHFHTNKNKSYMSQNEFAGVQIKTLPSLTSADAWHFESGYIGNEQRAIGIVHSYFDGREAEFYYTI